VTLNNGFDYFVVVDSALADGADTGNADAAHNSQFVAKATIRMFKGGAKFTVPDTYDARDVATNKYTNARELGDALLGSFPPLPDASRLR
jgi:hypothetical protein